MVVDLGGDAVNGLPSFAIVVSLSVCALAVVSSVGCVGGGAPDDPFDTKNGGSGGSSGPGGAPANAGSGGKGGTGGSSEAGSGGSASPDAGAKTSHFPLVDGAAWTYRHEYPQEPGRMPWDEIANMRASTYMDKPGFILEDEEDAQGERTASTMMVEGTAIYRVYKEVKVANQVAFNTTYDPGFLRYDEGWQQEGSSVDESYDSLQLCVMASSASKCAPGAMRKGTTSHTFKIVSLNAEITVPAGTFKNTVEVERINLGDPQNVGDEETKQFWFAAGVGKVRELDIQSGATEELSKFEIP
jgi:hypothetical protein